MIHHYERKARLEEREKHARIAREAGKEIQERIDLGGVKEISATAALRIPEEIAKRIENADQTQREGNQARKRGQKDT